jgi:hypothetical protein
MPFAVQPHVSFFGFTLLLTPTNKFPFSTKNLGPQTIKVACAVSKTSLGEVRGLGCLEIVQIRSVNPVAWLLYLA